MRILSTLIVLAVVTSSSAAQAQFATGHSIESIQQALNTPIPETSLRQAQQADDSVLRSGQVRGQKITVVTDTRVQRASGIVNRLLSAIRIDPSSWTVRVFDTTPRVENAFVYGGRYIYVYTGLMDNVRNDDELAFVLAHEIGHTLLHHGSRRGDDWTNTIGSLVEIGGALSKNSDRKERLGLVAGTIKAAYSREDEQEADAVAALLAVRAGYDASQGVNFFNRMINANSERNGRSEADLADAKKNIDQQVANCSRLRSQWDATPRIRNAQNAQIVTSACQTAQSNAQRYNAYLSQSSSTATKSILLNTHPADGTRIAALMASIDFLAKRRSLESLREIGQGYNVFTAMKHAQEAKASNQSAMRCNGDECRRDAAVAEAKRAVSPENQGARSFYLSESRAAGESCNSNSDCNGALRCSIAKTCNVAD